MTTKQHIENQIEQLKELTGLNLVADNNPTYGGYRLNDVDPKTGAQMGCFNQSSCVERMPAKYFSMYLSGIIGGLTFKK